jgi:uncharacterized membrane protein
MARLITSTDSDPGGKTALGRTASRWLLGAALVAAGIGHLTVQRQEFRAQVPAWFPAAPDLVVVVSGVVEIALGTALVTMRRRQVAVGLVAAAFFVVVFPGNIAQYVEGNDAFGLDTDSKRLIRLFFQPVLVLWALWSTGAWGALARRVRHA